ncbi:MAG: HD domain-containing protein [Candidatus Nanoarchaeia archaeon]
MKKENKSLENVKSEVYRLFGNETNERKYLYTRRNWIFPNHFLIMIDLSKDMCRKYGGDELICELACILHDVGLVYKREKDSPEGHENRSLEYAKDILQRNEFHKETISQVLECIRATDAEETPNSVNAKIVRTADALSQFKSVHFFAKATFAGNWGYYKKWLRKKATNNFKKICFKDEKKIAKPIQKYILDALDMYDEYFSKHANEVAKK